MTMLLVHEYGVEPLDLAAAERLASGERPLRRRTVAIVLAALFALAVARSYVVDPSAPSRACVLATPQEREAEAPSYTTVAPSANGQSSSGHRLLP
jgi:hypothetical protein